MWQKKFDSRKKKETRQTIYPYLEGIARNLPYIHQLLNLRKERPVQRIIPIRQIHQESPKLILIGKWPQKVK